MEPHVSRGKAVLQKKHQTASWPIWEIDAPCPFTKGIFLHSKRVWACGHTGLFASSGAFVESADMSVCVWKQQAEMWGSCVLGCTSAGINKWRGVMAETCLRADSTGEREITDCEKEERKVSKRSRWRHRELRTCMSKIETKGESRGIEMK